MAKKILEVRVDGCTAGFISDKGRAVASEDLPVYLRNNCDPFQTEHYAGGVLVYMSDREYEEFLKSKTSQ